MADLNQMESSSRGQHWVDAVVQMLQQSARYWTVWLSSFNLWVTQYELESKTSSSNYAEGGVQSASMPGRSGSSAGMFLCSSFQGHKGNEMCWQRPPSVINRSDFGEPQMSQPLHLIADCFPTCSVHIHTLSPPMGTWHLSCWNIHVWYQINKRL